MMGVIPAILQGLRLPLIATSAVGSDFGCMGSPFIAAKKVNAQASYQQIIVDASTDDIKLSLLLTVVYGNYLKLSFVAAGMDADNLNKVGKTSMDFSSALPKPKPWKNVWGAGQGIGAVGAVTDFASLVGRIEREYLDASARLTAGI